MVYNIMNEEKLEALIPAFIIYNVTSALYVVPISIYVSTRVGKYLNIKTSLVL